MAAHNAAGMCAQRGERRTTMMQRAIWALGGALMVLGAAHADASQLQVGRVRAQPGQSVTVPVIYRKGAGPVATALTTDIRFDTTALAHPRCAAGSALSEGGADKRVMCAEPSPGMLRLVLFGFNQDPVPNGQVATVTFDVSADAQRQPYRLENTPTASDAAGHDFRLARKNGDVGVGGQ
jgi:hypothetical protein